MAIACMQRTNLIGSCLACDCFHSTASVICFCMLLIILAIFAATMHLSCIMRLILRKGGQSIAGCLGVCPDCIPQASPQCTKDV